MDSFWTGIIVAAVVIFGINLLLLLRPPPPLSTQFGGRRERFTTRVPLEAAFKAVERRGDGAKARTVASDAILGRILLGDGMTFTSWGFYYLVEFGSRSDGVTEVTVAIRSKGFQIGPLVTRALQKLAERVQDVIEAG